MVISLVWEMAHRRATPAANQKIRSPPSGKAYTRTNRWAGSDQGPRTRRRSLLTSKSKLRHSVRFIVAFNEIKRSPWRDRPYERRAQKINIWRAHCRGGRASVQMRNNRRHTSSGPNDKRMLAETGGKARGSREKSRGFRIIYDSISGPRNEDFAVFDSE